MSDPRSRPYWSHQAMDDYDDAVNGTVDEQMAAYDAVLDLQNNGEAKQYSPAYLVAAVREYADGRKIDLAAACEAICEGHEVAGDQEAELRRALGIT